MLISEVMLVTGSTIFNVERPLHKRLSLSSLAPQMTPPNRSLVRFLESDRWADCTMNLTISSYYLASTQYEAIDAAKNPY